MGKLWWSYCLIIGLILPSTVLQSAQHVSGHEIEKAMRDLAVTRISFDAKGIPTFIEGKLMPAGGAGNEAEMAYTFFEQHCGLFGLVHPRTDLRIAKTRKDRLGMVHLSMHQYYHDVPVYARRVLVHFAASGEMKTINGDLLSEITVPFTPRIPLARAVECALSAVLAVQQAFSGNKNSGLVARSSELVVFPSSGVTHLAWLVRITRESPPGDWECFVDALDGSVIETVDRIIAESGQRPQPGPRPLFVSGLAQRQPESGAPAHRRIYTETSVGGRIATHVPSCLSAAGWDTVMSETFEGQFPKGLWTVSADTVVDATWGPQNFKSHGGSKSAWCAASGSRSLPPSGGAYRDSMASWMVYGPIDLSNTVGAEISFFLSSVTEPDHDNFYAAASIDNNDYYGVAWSGNHEEWTKQKFDLSDVYSLGNLCGQPQVYVAFVFVSDSASHHFAGSFLDDITLRLFPTTGIPPGDAIGTGTGVLGNAQNHIDAYGAPVRYYLEDRTRRADNDPHGHHGNMRNDQSILTKLNTAPLPMYDDDNVWQDSLEAPGVDAQVYTGLVYDYMLSEFGRNSYNDSGSTMLSLVERDYGVPPYDMNNALWMGDHAEYTNVTSDRRSMAGCLDVVGHEWAHGITQCESGLLARGESGALNESFSDMIGVSLGFASNLDPDWQQGEHSFKDGQAERDLASPHVTLQPDTYVDDPFWKDNAEANIHMNDGVPNKMFYLLSQGGTHNGVTVTGIGVANAMKILYRANCYYWTPTTRFSDAKECCISAANDLDAIGNWGTQTRKAWEAVKVGISVSPPHFQSAWYFRPYRPMMIKVLQATVDGADLGERDEIAVFDDTLCVGLTVLHAPISTNQPATLASFADDPITPDPDGFIAGHAISFRFWRATIASEVPNNAITATYNAGHPLFASEDSATVVLTAHGPASVGGTVSGDQGGAMPKEPLLLTPYPNPFNPSVTLAYYVPRATSATLTIYNILGGVTRTLTSGPAARGYHSVVWDGRNDEGISVATGVYLVRFGADGVLMTEKLLLSR
jgi:Zn-dependent metalloprotease